MYGAYHTVSYHEDIQGYTHEVRSFKVIHEFNSCILSKYYIYCRYGVKHYPIHPSIHPSVLYERFDKCSNHSRGSYCLKTVNHFLILKIFELETSYVFLSRSKIWLTKQTSLLKVIVVIWPKAFWLNSCLKNLQK